MALDADRVQGETSRLRWWPVTAFLTGSLALHLLLLVGLALLLARYVSPSHALVKAFELQPVALREGPPVPAQKLPSNGGVRPGARPVSPVVSTPALRPRRRRPTGSRPEKRRAVSGLAVPRLAVPRPAVPRPAATRPAPSPALGSRPFPTVRDAPPPAHLDPVVQSRETTLQEKVAGAHMVVGVISREERKGPSTGAGPVVSSSSAAADKRGARRGGPPRTARPSQQKTGLDRAAVARRIRRALERVLVYPLRARKMGLEGKVVLSFRIDSAGRARQVRVLHSAGPLLDRAAVVALHRAEPLPRFSGEVSVPLRFRLDD